MCKHSNAFLFKKKKLMYLFLAVLGLCYCVDFSLVVVCGLILVASLVGAQALGRSGLSNCGPWAQKLQLLDSSSGSILECTSSVALQHVVSSQIRDQTCVSCIGSGFFTTEPPGKQTLNVFSSPRLVSSDKLIILTFFLVSVL